MPFRSSESASRKTSTAATCRRAAGASHGPTEACASSNRVRRASSTSASASGSSETSEKKTQLTMYSVALGSSLRDVLEGNRDERARIRERGARAEIAITGD